MRQSTDRRAVRPVGPAAAAVSTMLTRAWSLPARRNFVAIERNVQVPMSDGTVLLADHYLPVTSRPAATVLVRCPYGRGMPFSLLQAQLVAERGFHVLLQSCRGTFGSGGQFEPMRHEIGDGQDTVTWLRGQSWFDGRLATFGASYLGFVQWALAMDPPPELRAAVVYVGPHDLSRVVYRHGVFALVGGWQDLFLEQTLEQYRALAGRDVPTRMIIGPWTHVDASTRSGPAFAESLAWLDRYVGQDPEDPEPGHSARIWVGGATLSLAAAGVRDNRPVEQRPDVLVFTSEPLDEPVEVIGDVTAELRVTRDNPNADLFVRLCDVDRRGRSRNVCDGIVRLTAADPLTGTVRVGMTGAAHRFGRGHRLRLQVAGGAHPRFARNPGNGQVEAPAKDFVVTRYSVQHPSALVVSQTDAKAAAHA
ncbi:MAG TPA: CocE/NonD family hydrolase [Streptosporangiaceae bacterium]|nr:CocE/NonD family hydrolase [Streptosporangiaceae bacterium]